MPIPKLTCILNRHAPIRAQVVWDGDHYIGTCKSCGREIRRIKQNKWQIDWLDRSANPIPPLGKTRER